MFDYPKSDYSSRMTLDEAIQHCREKEDCSACGQEHTQLREWLEDYKRMKTDSRFRSRPVILTEDYDFVCPNCGTDNIELLMYDTLVGYNYCQYCGQRLDWGGRNHYEHKPE